MNEESYNQIAQWFVDSRRNSSENEYILKFTNELKSSSAILDVGCGGGIPIAKYLVEKGFKVTGIDFSEKMILLAKKHVPAGTFLKADIDSYIIDEKYEGIIAWDALFHIERKKQKEIFIKLYNCLKDNGIMLFTYGGSEWEGISQMCGSSFFYSGYSPKKLKEILCVIGFKILIHEIDDPSSHGHMVVMVKKQ